MSRLTPCRRLLFKRCYSRAHTCGTTPPHPTPPHPTRRGPMPLQDDATAAHAETARHSMESADFWVCDMDDAEVPLPVHQVISLHRRRSSGSASSAAGHGPEARA